MQLLGIGWKVGDATVLKISRAGVLFDMPMPMGGDVVLLSLEFVEKRIEDYDVHPRD